jgi:hypothetical protein
MKRLYRILREEKAGSHIIYVGRRKDADDIAAELDGKDFSAARFAGNTIATYRCASIFYMERLPYFPFIAANASKARSRARA